MLYLQSPNGGCYSISDDLSCASFRQARDEYCENITSTASPELDNLIKETLQHPWEQAHADGKIQYMVRPGMMSGHHEGNADLHEFVKDVMFIKYGDLRSLN